MTHPSLAAQVRATDRGVEPACDNCFAVLRIAPANEIHQAGLVVAKDDGFMRRVRLCYTCRRTVEVTSRD